MESIMKSEVFFVIASIGVIIITVGVSIALYYIIRLLKTVDAVSEDVKENITAFGSWVRSNAFTKRFFASGRKPRRPLKHSSPSKEE